MSLSLPLSARQPVRLTTPAETAEFDLIRAAQRGDHEAFNHLVAAHQQRVYAVAFYLLSDPASAADATQEAFIAAYRSLATFHHGSLKNWLFRIVTNKCHDHLRELRRQACLPLDDFEENDDRFASREPGPEAVAQQRELACQLDAALAALPIADRQLVVLCDVQGLSYPEAAQVTGYPLGTVKSKLSRARAKLRAVLCIHPDRSGASPV